MMNEGLALEARGLVKSFGDFKALNGISFEVKAGECFGLLGPNGAGKSTCLKMIYGHLMPTAGDLYILGMNVRDAGREIRARIGVVPQDEGLDVELTVKENLMIFSKFYGISKSVAESRVLDLLKMMRLDEMLDHPVESLSGGYRRRLAIARGLLNYPEVLVLDEPSLGLDPQVRIWIWDFLHKIKEEKKTIILSTHYMEEAESLCDRLAIVDKGQILAIGSPQDLIRQQLGPEMVEFEAAASELGYFLNRLKERKLQFFVVGRLVFVPFPNEQDARALVSQINSKRIAIRKTTLSDVFLCLAGHDLRESVS